MKKIYILLFLFIFCSISYGNSEKIIRRNLKINESIIDPQICTDSDTAEVLSYIFEGLTRIDSKGKPVPGVAESWSNNGNIWTFKLRKSAKWANGEPVIARDFVNAWERALNPNNEFGYAYIMYCIKGAQEYNEGTYKNFSLVGLKAIDNYTLQVTLKEPLAYFPSLVSFYIFYPQNTNFLNNNIEYGYYPETTIGNGAFGVDTWNSNEKMILKKSENYWNKDKININKIELLMFDADTALVKYKEGLLDIIEIDSMNAINYKNSKDLKISEDGTIWYLGLNTENLLFSNKKIRQAMAMSIDRKALVNEVKDGLGAVSESFVPLGIAGKKEFFRNEYNQSLYNISFNPQKAKELFEEGLKELKFQKSEIDTIVLLTGESKASVKEAEFYANQFHMNLGLNVKIEKVSFEVKLQKMEERDYTMVIAGWGADYNDPMTFLDLWLSYSEQNKTGWENEKYDKLIETAKTEMDYSKRIEILAKAEKLLMEELPIIPIYYRQHHFLVKPNVKGVSFQIITPTINMIDSSIE